MRLTVLGGSSVGTPALVLALRALALTTDLHVMLYGRSAQKLEIVGRACRAAAAGTGLHLEWSTNLPASLTGTDFVLNQVRVGGLEGRKFDEQFPRALGLVGEETVGAGGFSNALRTIPVVLEICEAVQQYAPTARIVNLTNPSSLVHQAMERYMGATVISGCDIPVTVVGWLHRLLAVPPGTLEVAYLGSNHLGWVTAARDLQAGQQNRLPEALARLEELPGFPLDVEWVRALGALPGPYLRYFYHRDRYIASGPTVSTRATELMEIESGTLQAYTNLPANGGPAEVAQVLSKRRPHWYDEIIGPLLAALLSSDPRRLILQVTNGDRVPTLPPHTVVELPVLVSRSRFEPDAPTVLPADCEALLVQNAAYEDLAVQAIVEEDRWKAVRALVANPLVGTVEQAVAVVDAVWSRERASLVEGRG